MGGGGSLSLLRGSPWRSPRLPAAASPLPGAVGSETTSDRPVGSSLDADK